MAYETEFANLKRNTDEQSAILGAALVQSANMLPLVASEDLPVNSMKKRFWKDGSLDAADVVAESGDITFAAGHELTQTATDCSIVKYAGAAKLTPEAARFTAESPQSMLVKVVEDITRDIDGDIKTLASSFSNSVVSTDEVLTPEDLLLAVFTVEFNTKNVSVGRKIAILDNKGVYQLKKYGLESSASSFTRPAQATLLESAPAAVSGLVATGYLGNIDIVQTSNMPFSAGVADQLLYDPALAIRGCIGGAESYFQEPETGGIYWTILSFVFAKFVEWYDEAGVLIQSGTDQA